MYNERNKGGISMKKTSLLGLLLFSFCLTGCVHPTQDPIKDDPIIDNGDEEGDKEEEDLFPWTTEQKALFDQYLGGYYIPTLPVEATFFQYRLGSLDIRSAMTDDLLDTYQAKLEKDGFSVKYEEAYLTYECYKDFNDDYKVYVEFFEDIDNEPSTFQIYAKLSKKPKDREHVWTNEEKELFNQYLEGVVLPYPEANHGSIKHSTNFNDDCVYIVSDRNDDVLSKYLSDLKTMGFDLSKHPKYGIDTAFKQLNNHKYIELWVAIAEENGSTWFEVYGYTRSGVYKADGVKFIEFGSYPQGYISSYNPLFNSLINLVGIMPTDENHRNWNVFSDFVVECQFKEDGFYKDFEYNGDKYRATYYLRPRSVTAVQPYNDDYYGYQHVINGYYVKEVHIFKYEPIIWEVMKSGDGISFLAPTNMLDNTYFSAYEEPDGYYANNYEHSFIRKFINDEFYNTAFSEEEKAKIQTTLVDNSLTANAPSEDDYQNYTNVAHENPTMEDYLSPNTNDKVFLLSRQEILDLDFGYKSFTDWENIDYNKACKAATDYCLSRGALRRYAFNKTIYSYSSSFYLRTPLITSYYGEHVHLSGETNGMQYAFTSALQALGVYPCINVKF